jgi:protoporphyrinogen oxidase
MSTVILGGGVTGLAAGWATGGLVIEAAEGPGGICASYHCGGYRFERGGGHWIFGGDADVLQRLEACTPLTRYTRRSSVHFLDRDVTVPFPVQHHVAALGPTIADAIAGEPRIDMPDAGTMRDWLLAQFGPTLCAEFFFPFHDAYTAGLYSEVAPQDGYKSPGVGGPSTGYNTTFAYPAAGLDALTRAMAARCAHVEYGARVIAIDTAARRVRCADGRAFSYDRLISTLPLHVTLALAQVAVTTPADPYTSVLVANVGACRGPKCPDAHWVYMPRTASGFHRVGFYSNVADSFLPAGASDRVALYAERTYRGGDRPASGAESAALGAAIAELQAIGYIGAVDVVDGSWIDVAYTWRRPGSTWVEDGCRALHAVGIEPVGRYAQWRFQGIADSVRDGFATAP